MECKQKFVSTNKHNVVQGHRKCETLNAKWLCFKDAYQKFHRPNFHDIGGTYENDVCDYWFMCKTERVGNIFLLHLFIINHQEGSFTVGLSYGNKIRIYNKDEVFLSTILKDYNFENIKPRSHTYIYTYNFTEIDIDLLKNKKMHIAINFDKSLGPKTNSYNFVELLKLNHDFSALLADPIGSDFTIESADGEKFHVHKVFLAAHSDVFKAMLKTETAESQNNYVKLVDVGKDDLAQILEFIYTGSVKNLENCNWFNLLMLSDKYNIIGLKCMSEYLLSEEMNKDNVVEVLMVADMYNSQHLKMRAMTFIKKNVDVLHSKTFSEISRDHLFRELCTFLTLHE